MSVKPRNKNIITRIFVFLLILIFLSSVVYADDIATNYDQTGSDIITTDSGVIDPTTSDDAIDGEGTIDGEDDQETDSEDENNPEDEVDNEDDAVSGSAVQNTVPKIDALEENIIEAKATVSGNAVTVTTFDELKSYMQDGSNGITEFYLGADITGIASGITVNSAKTNIILSGKDPVTGEIHTYKEYASAALSASIQVSANTTITIQDMNIDGNNYYGVVNTSISANNVYIKYDSVVYDGPQLCYNRRGTLHLKDTTVSMPSSPKNLIAPTELVEVSKVILEGQVNLSKQNSTLATFWMFPDNGTTGNSSFTVLSGAKVNINSASYLFYREIPAVLTQLTIEDGASFNAEVNGGITYIDHYLKGIQIGENAQFRYLHKGTAGAHRTLMIDGDLIVENNAVFEVRRSQASYDATINTRLIVNMRNSTSNIKFNNPKRVLLINGLNTVDGLISFPSGGRLTINTKVMNLWNTLPSGFSSNINWIDPLDSWSTDDLPAGVWNQHGFESIQLAATFSSPNSTVNPNAVSVDNYQPATEKNTQTLTTENFLNGNSRMLSVGNSKLDFNYMDESSAYIKGNAPGGSYVNADYESNYGAQSNSGIVSDTGEFSFTVNGSLIPGSDILGTVQLDFLRGYDYNTVLQNTGDLKFYKVPSALSFYSSYVPTSDDIVKREDPDWSIEVQDTRSNPSSWHVTAVISSPLSAVSGSNQYTLPNALVYKIGSNASVFGSDAILIYSKDSDFNDITTIGWNDDEGPLISINAGDMIKADSSYTTDIIWTLVDGPQ